jgi:class 3 adenylate cyclase
MASARTDIRGVVAEARGEISATPESASPTDAKQSNRESPIPAASPLDDQQAKSMKNLRNVLDFVSQLTAMSSKKPQGALEDLLDELGFRYGKGSADDDDDENSTGSTSSFSFNFEAVSSSNTQSSNMLLNARSLNNTLSRFSSEMAHWCWIENNRALFGMQHNEEAFLTSKARKERQEETEQTVVPWHTQGAVLFIDLSGYSKIASFLTSSGGAHALSEAVNAYFEAILSVVVAQYGGDVITFAGDAVVACFCASDGRSPSDCALLAAACALDLQRKCGMSPVKGTDLAFRLHIGITFGELVSQVLKSKSTEVMQSAYHFVSGHPLTQTAIVVDHAKTGEICITEEVHRLSKGLLHTQELETVTESGGAVRIFKLSGIDDDYEDQLSSRRRGAARSIQRSPWIDSKLVPNLVAQKLRQGFKTAHIAEMRFLCVLFIRKQLDSVNAEEWFSEVQLILDQSRCPIVQMLHDDKGTHLIAAVNLYQTQRNPANIGVLAARRLVERETGCAIGMACGQTFCGITGSEQSCRWDITGPQVVRACRLMQHAVTLGIPAVFDGSVYQNASDVSQLNELPEKVSLKGSPQPVEVYTLSEASVTVTSGIMDLSWEGIPTNAAREELGTQFLREEYQKGVALVSGPIGCGKRSVICAAVEAVGGFSFFVHFSARDVRELTFLRTVFDWFSRHADEDLNALAKRGSQLLESAKLTQTLNAAHQLVNRIIQKGLRVVLCVAYAQFLDSASIRLIKSIVTSDPVEGGKGKFLFMLTAYALYGTPTPNAIADDLQRGLSENLRKSSTAAEGAETRHSLQTKLIHIRLKYPASGAELKPLVDSVTFFKLQHRASEVLLEATGGCMHLMSPLFNHLRDIFVEKSQKLIAAKKSEGSLGGKVLSGADLLELPMPATLDGTIHITPAGEDYLLQQIYWPQVAPELSPRFTELYDALHPRLQLVVRVMASLTATTGSANRYHVYRVLSKLNPKITEERTNNDIDELISLEILRPYELDWGEICFSVPAMADVIGDLLTPEQDKTLKRHAHTIAYSYYQSDEMNEMGEDYRPVFISFQAGLARAAGQVELYKKLLATSWRETVVLGTRFPEVRARMESRLAIEYRRFPDLVQPELFKDAAEAPLLLRLKNGAAAELENQEILHPAMEFGMSYMPTFSLGPISGEMQKLVWAAVMNLLDFTRRAGDAFLTKEDRHYLDVDVEAYGRALEVFEKTIPQLPQHFVFGRPPGCPAQGECAILDKMMLRVNEGSPGMTVKEEKELAGKVQRKPTNLAEALEQLLQIRAYHYCVQIGRRERILRYVRSLTDVEGANLVCPSTTVTASQGSPTTSTSTSATVGVGDPVRRAFYRFIRPYPIPQTVIHEALLDLATAGWRSKYYSVNLQLIRDEILRNRTASLDDFKAYLLSLQTFGEEITIFSGSLV